MFIKRILILVFLVLVILGCSKTVNSKDITYNAEKDLIVLESNEEKAFTGTVEHYNEKGILQFKLNLKKGKTLPNNLTFKKQEVFSENYLIFTTVDEMLTDTTLVYFKDLNIPFTGKIEYPKEDNDAQVLITYKDGKKHGEYALYYENENIKLKCNYKDGKLHGEIIWYYKNGNIEAKDNYKDGELHGENIGYYENGNIKLKGNYKDGKLHGEIILYYENGNIELKRDYKDGELHGEMIEYHENGNIRKKSNYIDGKLQ